MEKLHFRRHEFKYLIRPDRYSQLWRELKHFMLRDAHMQEDIPYTVNSIYFDSDDYSAYWEKLWGVKTRKKFRIRTYAKHFNSKTPIFLECKGKQNEFVVKDRVVISYGQLHSLLEDPEPLWALAAKGKLHKLLSEFLVQKVRRRLKPVVYVIYNRLAYQGRFDPRFRVTFDSRVKALPYRGYLSMDADQKAGDTDITGYRVLESKFRGHLPAWFGQVVKDYELSRVPVSKYVHAINGCGLESDPDRYCFLSQLLAEIRRKKKCRAHRKGTAVPEVTRERVFQ
ncbi:MAG: polyphosphate polymerase domain-containing protein [Candidatus Omnitrophica bacterium]|nr:polyphosphate polymerase domain-containing protein [Candidatus Omnitrophota bacterium]